MTLTMFMPPAPDLLASVSDGGVDMDTPLWEDSLGDGCVIEWQGGHDAITGWNVYGRVAPSGIHRLPPDMVHHYYVISFVAHGIFRTINRKGLRVLADSRVPFTGLLALAAVPWEGEWSTLEDLGGEGGHAEGGSASRSVAGWGVGHMVAASQHPVTQRAALLSALTDVMPDVVQLPAFQHCISQAVAAGVREATWRAPSAAPQSFAAAPTASVLAAFLAEVRRQVPSFVRFKTPEQVMWYSLRPYPYPASRLNHPPNSSPPIPPPLLTIEQWKAVYHAVHGTGPALYVERTGGGKSITAYLSAIFHVHKVTVMVVPFTCLQASLLHDARSFGVRRVHAWGPEAREGASTLGGLLLVSADDALRSEPFAAFLQVLEGTGRLARIIVDEIHEFAEGYRALAQIFDRLSRSELRMP